MSTSLIVEIADAVLDELNTGVAADAFSQVFTPSRTYNTELELEDTDILHVDVVPGDVATDQQDRICTQYDCRINIAIRKRFQTEARTDALMELAQEILQYFGPTNQHEPRPLASFTDAHWMDLPDAIKAPYLPDHLRHLNQYTCILALLYRTFS